ncbi:MAG: hypothetical protein ACREAC_28370, partial [Blastocatellia bacterium]
MKSSYLGAVVLLMLAPLAANAQSPKAQATRTATAQGTAQTFTSFWTKFKAAVAGNDKEAVASLTELPFGLNGENLDRAAFIAQFDSIFDKQVKRCFPRAKPIRDQEYFEVMCGD